MTNLQILKMSTHGITVKEVMAFYNCSYNAAFKQLNKLRKDNLVDSDRGTYTATPEGIRELSEAVAEIDGVNESSGVEIGLEYQLCALQPGAVKESDKTHVTKDEAVEWLTANYAAIHQISVYTAIAMGDFSQLDKLIEEK